MPVYTQLVARYTGGDRQAAWEPGTSHVALYDVTSEAGDNYAATLLAVALLPATAPASSLPAAHSTQALTSVESTVLAAMSVWGNPADVWRDGGELTRDTDRAVTALSDRLTLLSSAVGAATIPRSAVLLIDPGFVDRPAYRVFTQSVALPNSTSGFNTAVSGALVRADIERALAAAGSAAALLPGRALVYTHGTAHDPVLYALPDIPGHEECTTCGHWEREHPPGVSWSSCQAWTGPTH